ncbi:PilZ domain-containing protein [Pararhizobium antarcticum]|uniref:ATP-binding protein n=1 Tax=Pararhizobium antarcticum TaxID=1798805 RepID=A0A657LPT8_9HYPH|nr:PilZ domain-containing protein [Pararhizobium antarcticum]OJF93493.1 ATP-binding protein [Pararhizobium antarcticum]OJF96018.1 ATP-binding protein [Rhizobium sp. 58]
MPQHQVTERKVRRTATTFTGTVTCKNGTSRGIVKDLSPSGICFQLHFDINAKTGQEVTIDSEELGHLTGIVHWYRGDRIGIRLLHTSSNRDAQLTSFYKYFR